MSKPVVDELLCHLVIRNLEPDEYKLVSSGLNCKRGGIDSNTKKAYVSMALESKNDWLNADKFLSQYEGNFNDIKISYAAYSKQTWGRFNLPKGVVKFAEKYGIDLEIQFATPSRK